MSKVQLELTFSSSSSSSLSSSSLPSVQVARPRIFKTIIIRTLAQLADIVNTPDEILGMIS